MLDNEKDGHSGGVPSSRAMLDDPTVVTLRRAQSGPLRTDGQIVGILSVVRGRHEGQVFALRVGETSIGRGQGVDLYLSDRGVSRTHVRISVDLRGRLELFDLESTNGTFLNGERVVREPLRIGDRIRIGPDALLELQPATRRAQPPRPVTVVDREPDAPVFRGKRPPPALPQSTEDTTPPTEPDMAPCWGYSEAAIDAYSRLLDIRRKRLGERHPSVAEMLETMAIALQDNGHTEPALARLAEALDIFEGQATPAPRATARVLMRMASSEATTGRQAVAIRRLERAEQLLRPLTDGQIDLARTRLALAQLLCSTGTDPTRSVMLAHLARDAFAKLGPSAKAYYDEAQAWLLGSTCALAAERAS